MPKEKLEAEEPRWKKIRPYTDKYAKKAIKQYILKFNRNTEPEIIEFLDSKENKNNYIRDLIKADMAKSK